MKYFLIFLTSITILSQDYRVPFQADTNGIVRNGSTFKWTNHTAVATDKLDGAITPTNAVNSSYLSAFLSRNKHAEFFGFNPVIIQTNSISSITNAMGTNRDTVIFPPGTFVLTNEWILQRGQTLRGSGWSADGADSNYFGATKILLVGNNARITGGGFEVNIENIHVHRLSGTNFNIYMPYAHGVLRNVTSSGTGYGGRIGGVTNGFNADQMLVENCRFIFNNIGFMLEDSTTAALPDANIVRFISSEFRNNTSHGYVEGKSLHVTHLASNFSENGGLGVLLKTNSYGTRFIDCYFEQGGATTNNYDLYAEDGARGHFVDGSRPGAAFLKYDANPTPVNQYYIRNPNRVHDNVHERLPVNEIEIFKDHSSVVGKMSITQTTNDTYLFNSKPGNSFSYYNFMTDTTNRAQIKVGDLVSYYQMNLTGASSSFEGFLRLSDTRARMELGRYSEDNMWIGFDNHFDGANFIGDTTTASFQLYKNNDKLQFNAFDNTLLGQTNAFANAFSISSTAVTTYSNALVLGYTTASGVATVDASKVLKSHSTVSDTELGYLDGLTSSVTNQLSGKQPISDELTNIDTNAPGANKYYGTDGSGTKGFYSLTNNYQYVALALTNITANIATGNGYAYYIFPVTGTVRRVWANLFAASSAGQSVFDINLNGSTIMASTKITIGAVSNVWSGSYTTQPVITSSNFNAGDTITVDIDTAGTDAKGAQVAIEWYPR